MQPIYVFFALHCMVIAYLQYELLKELRFLRSDILHLNIPMKLSEQSKNLMHFHQSHYDNIIDQMPTRSFLQDLMKNREDINAQIKVFNAESRKQRFERLTEAFSPQKINREVNNVESSC